MPGPLTSARAARRQTGFTMIELMISLLIGLFLLGGLVGLVQSNKRAFSTQNLQTQLMDSERLALTMMNDVVEQAGYFPDPTTNTAGTAFAAAAPFAAQQYLYGVTAASAQGDTLSVRYTTASGDGILNCSGGSNTSGSNILYTSVFSVAVTGGVSQLVCTLNGTAYPLVNNVTNMSVLYGVNTSGSGSNVDTYMTADKVTSTSNWFNVVSAQITLTLTNPLASGPGQPIISGTSATVTVTRTINIMKQTG